MLNKLQHKFLHGYCNVFALALNKLTNNPIVAIMDNWEIVHFVIENSKGEFLDASGVTSLSCVKQKYGLHNISYATVSAQDAKIYQPHSAADMDDAFIIINQLRNQNKLPKF